MKKIKEKIAELEKRLATEGVHPPVAAPHAPHPVEHELKHHDWFHEMADKNEYLQKGREHAAHIGRQLHHLPYEHAKALVDKHSNGRANYTPEHHAKGTYWDMKY